MGSSIILASSRPFILPFRGSPLAIAVLHWYPALAQDVAQVFVPARVLQDGPDHGVVGADDAGADWRMRRRGETEGARVDAARARGEP